MIWVNIIAILILFFSFIGGIKEGAVKRFSGLVEILIAIPIAGTTYHILTGILSFLPGENWEGFLGFFITLAIINAIMHFVLWLPRKVMQKLWNKGFIFRIAGGLLQIYTTAIHLAVFTLGILAYPIFGWLERCVAGSSVLSGLVTNLGFIQSMLPKLFGNVIDSLVSLPILFFFS